jgi:hypothetical protein
MLAGYEQPKYPPFARYFDAKVASNHAWGRPNVIALITKPIDMATRSEILVELAPDAFRLERICKVFCLDYPDHGGSSIDNNGIDFVAKSHAQLRGWSHG